MNTEIYIEDFPVDITAALSSLLTFAIDDVKDFASRQTTFSKTVVLPGTNNNNKLFGAIFETGVSNDYNANANNIGYNFNASKSARCVILQDFMQTFKGTMRMLQINKDRGRVEYEVAFNGELTGLNVALSGGKLEQLDFSAYDEIYSHTNIQNSWNNTATGLYYPLIDYGNYSLLKHDWDIHTFRPALFVKEYIDKMFLAAGYRYECDLFNTPRFKKLIVPYNRKILTRKDYDVLEAIITSTKVNPSIFSWDAISSLIFALTTSNQHIEYTATPSISGTLNVTVSGNFVHGDITVAFYKNGIQILTNTFVWNGISNPQFFSYTQTLPSQSFGTGDYISCIVTLNNTTAGYDKNITTNTVEFLSDLPQDVAVDFFDNIFINDTLPKNIRQIDFLSSIIKLFNLYVYEDRFDKSLIKIAPFIDFYSTDSSNAVDWTYKLNRDSVIKIKPLSEINSKSYKFNYKDDSDFWNDLYKKRYNKGYGSYIFDSSFEFASQQSSLELIFAATPLVGYGSEDKVYPTIIKRSGEGAGVKEEHVDSVIRILQTKKVTGVTNWDIKNGVTTLSTINYYGYAGHFDDPDNPQNDLNFGVLEELFFILVTGNLTATQFNVYWSSYMAEITDKDSKMLSGNFYLTPKDIFDLDFSKYIYVDGTLFRLNKITDYNLTIPSDCDVQLLRTINTIY